MELQPFGSRSMSSSKPPMAIDRVAYADKIVEVLEANLEGLKESFQQPNQVQSCFIDDLLPTEWASSIFSLFPKPTEMMERKSLREHKFVAAQMDRYHPVLEEIIYAFQDSRVVKLTEQ